MHKIYNMINTEIDTGADKYIHNGKYVPRVTTILSDMLHEEYLMNWSNAMGWKKQSHKKIMEDAATVGTHVHNGAEAYLKGEHIDESIYPRVMKYRINNGIESFKQWYGIVSSNNMVEILSIEETLTCEYFGGTLDILMKINNKIYLIDLKTSNHISYKYFYQMSAYKYLLELKNVKLDGIVILQLSKNDISFNEFILDLSLPAHNQFIFDCSTAFASLLHAYYNRHLVMSQYNTIFKV